METDRFGIPVNTSGPVPEDFYALIGRITVLAALLEDRLHLCVCRWTLRPDPQPEEYLAGESATRLIRELRSVIQGFPDDLQPAATDLLDRCDEAARRRNAVVHSLWPHDGQADVRGWRTVRHANRQDPENPVNWTGSAGLPALVTELVDLYAALRSLEDRVPIRHPKHPTG